MIEVLQRQFTKREGLERDAAGRKENKSASLLRMQPVRPAPFTMINVLY